MRLEWHFCAILILILEVGFFSSGSAAEPRETVGTQDPVFLDKRTKLMWQRQDDGKLRKWNGARDYCLDLQLGGYEDWLMPSLNELKSIIKPNTYAPAINPVHFPKTKYTLYWSSSNSHLETSEALGVCFNGGLVASLDRRAYSYVRCVRHPI